MAAELEWVERFSGAYEVDRDPGREHPVSLVLRCSGALAALRAARADLVGIVRAPGLIGLASVVGTVSLEKGPRVRYTLASHSERAGAVTLELERSGFLRNAYAALTTLRGEARDDAGRRLATLRLRVDVRSGALVSGVRLRG